MMPIIFRIPFLNIDVPGYGLMMMIGFLAAIMWAARRAARSGANPDVILNCGFVALIAGVAGGRLMYVLHNWSEFGGRGGLLDVAWAVIDVRKGGLEYYGGFILASVSISAWIIFIEKVSWRWYLDIMAPSATVGLAFGRVGCLLNGCCFGAPTDLPWKISFPFGSPAQIFYWEHRAPGTELPAQLIFATPNRVDLKGLQTSVPGLMPTGSPGYPITRESIAATDADLAAAQEAEEKAVREFEAVTQKFPATDDSPAAKQARQQALAAWRMAEGKFGDLRLPMRQFNTTPAQLRTMAAEHRSIEIHPSQVYSTIMAFIVAGLLNAAYYRRKRDGQIICLLFFIEPISRYVIELLRADNPVDVGGQFTISQFLSICMMGAALLGLLLLQFMPPRSKRAALWTPPPETPKDKAAAKASAASA